MTEPETRRVGERGQIRLPKRVREAASIERGDAVEIRAVDGKIVMEALTDGEFTEMLAAGYRARASRDRALASELEGTSREANATLGDVPKRTD